MKTSTPPEQSPARDLTEPELARLGEFVWEVSIRLGDRLLPTVLEEAQFFRLARSEVHADCLLLGQGVRDVYMRMGEPQVRSTFQEGRLLWEAITEAIFFLRDERKQRVTVIDGDGEHPEPPPPPRAVDIEYIAQCMIEDTASERVAPPSQRELAARIRFALTLAPFCADAYRMQGELEEQAGNFQRARVAYERAMKIAGLHIGQDAIASAEVRTAQGIDFWFASSGREYLRPRSSLASLLWKKLDDPMGAIAHFQALLDLDPSDHQGNRYALMCCLLEVGHDETLGSTLARHRLSTPNAGDTEDITDTGWHYTYACWKFRAASRPDRSERGLQQATMALYQAFQENPHVPRLLLSAERLPAHDARMERAAGSPGEAIWYVDLARSAWKSAPRRTCVAERCGRTRPPPVTNRGEVHCHLFRQVSGHDGACVPDTLW